MRKSTGVKRSYKKALDWYLRAAPAPEAPAKNVHPRVLALVRLGYFYEMGLGVKQDTAQAIAWYQVAANDNDAEAKAAPKRLSPAQGIK